MSYTMLSTTILIAVVMLTCIKAVSGYKAGATRSVADLVLIVFSASIGAAISVASASEVGGYIYRSICNMEFYRDIVSEIGDIGSVTRILSELFAAVILFVPVFFIIYLIASLILRAVLKSYLGVVAEHDGGHVAEGTSLYSGNSRTVGGIVGGVCGLIISVIVFAPLSGFLKNTGALIGTLEDCIGVQILEDSEDVDDLFAYADDLMVSIVYEAGGRGIFDTLTVIEHDGRRISLSKEMEAVRSLKLDELGELVEDIVEGDARGADEILDVARQSVFAEALMHMSVQNAASKWLAREPYMGMSRPTFGNGQMFDRFLDEMLYVCVSSSRKDFSRDMLTFINVNKIFRDMGNSLFTDDYYTTVSALDRGDVLDEVRTELEKNPSMQRVIYVMNDILIGVVADEIADGRHTDYERDTLYRRIANAMNSTSGLTDKTRIDAIAQLTVEAFDEYDSYIPDSLADDMAAIFIERITGFGSVRTYDVEMFFEKYVNPY